MKRGKRLFVTFAKKKMTSDIRSRYWTFLFDNLKRSIEQIYQTCQSDPNPFQCQVRFFDCRKKHHRFVFS